MDNVHIQMQKHRKDLKKHLINNFNIKRLPDLVLKKKLNYSKIFLNYYGNIILIPLKKSFLKKKKIKYIKIKQISSIFLIVFKKYQNQLKILLKNSQQLKQKHRKFEKNFIFNNSKICFVQYKNKKNLKKYNLKKNLFIQFSRQRNNAFLTLYAKSKKYKLLKYISYGKLKIFGNKQRRNKLALRYLCNSFCKI